jgi:hypothetical protein
VLKTNQRVIAGLGQLQLVRCAVYLVSTNNVSESVWRAGHVTYATYPVKDKLGLRHPLLGFILAGSEFEDDDR